MNNSLNRLKVAKDRGFAIHLLLGALLIAGCGKHEEKLHLFIVSEYVPREVIDGFTRETGIPTDTEVFDTNEAMLSKLIANPSQYDLVQPSEYTVEHLIREKLLAPLDFEQIPNMSNLASEMRDLSYDPGQKYSVPYMSGTVGIIVNTDVIKEPIRGYADVFQEKYNQRIVVVDDNREIVSWAFGAQGIPINDVTPANLARVKPLLKRWISRIKVFAPATPTPPLLGGEADLGVIYSGDAAALIARDKRFVFVLPKEGAHRFVDNLCIPAGAKHKEAARKFINYVLKPEVSKIISDKFPYTNPNEAARKLLSPQQLANPASYPSGGAEHLEIFKDIGHAASDISALMTELRNGG